MSKNLIAITNKVIEWEEPATETEQAEEVTRMIWADSIEEAKRMKQMSVEELDAYLEEKERRKKHE